MKRREMVGDFIRERVPGHLITRFRNYMKIDIGEFSGIKYCSVELMNTWLKKANEEWEKI